MHSNKEVKEDAHTESTEDNVPLPTSLPELHRLVRNGGPIQIDLFLKKNNNLNILSHKKPHLLPSTALQWITGLLNEPGSASPKNYHCHFCIYSLCNSTDCYFGSANEMMYLIANKLLSDGANLDFYSACALGDASFIQNYLIRNPLAAFSLGPDGSTTLAWAARRGQDHLIPFLNRQGVNVNHINPHTQKNALNEAITYFGTIKTVKILINLGTKIRKGMLVDAKNKLEILEFLLSQKKDREKLINLKDIALISRNIFFKNILKLFEFHQVNLRHITEGIIFSHLGHDPEITRLLVKLGAPLDSRFDAKNLFSYSIKITTDLFGTTPLCFLLYQLEMDFDKTIKLTILEAMAILFLYGSPIEPVCSSHKHPLLDLQSFDLVLFLFFLYKEIYLNLVGNPFEKIHISLSLAVLKQKILEAREFLHHSLIFPADRVINKKNLNEAIINLQKLFFIYQFDGYQPILFKVPLEKEITIPYEKLYPQPVVRSYPACVKDKQLKRRSLERINDAHISSEDIFEGNSYSLFKQQIYLLLEKFKLFYPDHEETQNIFQHFKYELYREWFSGEQSDEYFATIKLMLEKIYTLLSDDAPVSAAHKLSALRRLPHALQVCAPGCGKHLQAIEYELSPHSISLEKCVTNLRDTLVDVIARKHIEAKKQAGEEKEHVIGEGNEIHVRSQYEYYASQWGLGVPSKEGITDGFVRLNAVEEVEFFQLFTEEYNPVAIVENLIQNFIEHLLDLIDETYGFKLIWRDKTIGSEKCERYKYCLVSSSSEWHLYGPNSQLQWTKLELTKINYLLSHEIVITSDKKSQIEKILRANYKIKDKDILPNEFNSIDKIHQEKYHEFMVKIEQLCEKFYLPIDLNCFDPIDDAKEVPYEKIIYRINVASIIPRMILHYFVSNVLFNKVEITTDFLEKLLLKIPESEYMSFLKQLLSYNKNLSFLKKRGILEEKDEYYEACFPVNISFENINARVKFLNLFFTEKDRLECLALFSKDVFPQSPARSLKEIFSLLSCFTCEKLTASLILCDSKLIDDELFKKIILKIFLTNEITAHHDFSHLMDINNAISSNRRAIFVRLLLSNEVKMKLFCRQLNMPWFVKILESVDLNLQNQFMKYVLANFYEGKDLQVSCVSIVFKLCILYGHVAAIKYILDVVSPRLKGDTEHFSPIHFAIKYNQFNVAIFLVEAGLNIENYVGGLGTALHYATKKNQAELVKVLLKHEANVHANLHPFEHRVLDVAVLYDSAEALRVILENTSFAMEELNKLAHRSILVSSKRSLSLLLQKGVDSEAKNERQQTLLQAAVMQKNLAMTQVLLTFFGRLNMNIRDEQGRTPLWYAVDDQREDMVKLLLNANADPLVKDIAGHSLLERSKHCRDIHDLLQKAIRAPQLSSGSLSFYKKKDAKPKTERCCCFRKFF